MGARAKPSSLLALAYLCALALVPCVLGQTVRHHTETVVTDAVDPAVTQAEIAIEKKDYASAEKLLLPVVAANPKDAGAWYDLGYVYKATDRLSQATDAYRKALAAKPDLYEANRSLGSLLLQQGQLDEAQKYLKAAISVMPGSTSPSQKALDWMMLGKAEQRSDPNGAVAAFQKAAALSPSDLKPHLLAGQMLQSAKNVNGAESEFHAVLKINPANKDALTGLVDLYRENDLPTQAESALRDYARQFPDDPRMHLLLGQSLLKSGNAESAVAEFDAGLKQDPANVGLLHEIAAMYASQKKFDLAAPRYEQLVKAAPNNADYHYQFGVVLMQLHKFPEAQNELIAALQRDAGIKEAYGELAIAASENKQYPLVIKVLDARDKLEPETAATYFLRATAYDNLKAYPQAAENYHKFLDASKGQSPENEWKARHRLIAIEPEGGKKKK